MLLYHIVILALIQGLTEFLPVSSSGHLVLVHAFFSDGSAKLDWDENLIMDVAVHVGTLLSVLVYFRRDVLKMLLGAVNIVKGNSNSEQSKLLLFVLVGSIPVIIAGLIIDMLEPDILHSLYVMATTTIVFGIILWWADKQDDVRKSLKDMTFKDALIIGLSQVLALVPGTSRSGITMTSARFLGYSRTESAHYSLLLAMVAISGAGTLGGIKLIGKEDVSLNIEVLIAVIFSFISGLLAVSLMMKFLEKSSFTVFAVYRIILGICLLIIISTGMA